MEGALTFKPVEGVNMVGFGSAVPGKPISNREFFDKHPDIAEVYKFDESEIVRRTGVESRYWVNGQSIVDLMQTASTRALENAGIDNHDKVKAIIAGTWTKEKQTPDVAEILQNRLGIKNGYTDTDSHACASFASALIKAYQLYEMTDLSGPALVTGGDILSRRTDQHDAQTAYLFGDAAGAVILEKSHPDLGLLAAVSISETSNEKQDLVDLLYCDIDKNEPGDSTIQMKGREVFKYVASNLPDFLNVLLGAAGVCVEEIDLWFPHQANQRISNSLQKELNIPPEKMPSSIQEYGNSSAGTIPVTLHKARNEGMLDGEKTIAVFGFGAAMTIAGAILRVAPNRRSLQ